MYSWTASARIVAASIIDWTNLGQRIGDRERPLADKTMKRIQAGINRYWAVPEREPLIVNQVSGADASRSTPVRDAAPTMVAGGRHASLLVPVEGRAGKAAGSIAEPYRTQTTRNETGLLATAPFIAELRGGGSDARSTTQPLATVTASGNHHALVMRNNHGGAEMSTPVGEPVRTITTAGHQSLISGGTPAIQDCSFRMLSPKEIQQAMAFPEEYRILGTKREQVRMAGNAVTPPAARDLVAAVAASLETT
ncbi:DNA cytosine methyltransferase [Brachybacterium tyrofermentans]|uniref:DNA cytosine methyltransferase n=2 Tax=Brachybacterium tyrofermentans TaxID=47848 RepID=UPI003FD0E793